VQPSALKTVTEATECNVAPQVLLLILQSQRNHLILLHKFRCFLMWTDEEDRLLVPVLQDARVVARATDTSFRTEVWQKASKALILGGFNCDNNACELRYRRVCTITIC
jgi:hypothetical protein